MNPKISIIIPVYNAAEHVEECLKSVATQKYGNYEVILVDDGSTDESAQLCEGFISSHRDIQIKLYTKENGGPGTARNFGLDRCSADSEFVVFIDSDDEISPDCLSALAAWANEHCLVYSPLTRCNKANRPPLRRETGVVEYKSPWVNVQFLAALKNGIINSSCGNCYSLRVIRENCIRFRNTLPEDTFFNIDYIDKVGALVELQSSFYYYYTWGDTVTTKPTESLFTNYILIQKMLYTRVPASSHHEVDLFAYPQYRANAMGYLREKNYSVVKKYIGDECVKRSLHAYVPTSFPDRIFHFLLKSGSLRLLCMINTLLG